MIVNNAKNISKLFIQDGLIANSTNQNKIFDCNNHTLLPQFIDLNVFPKNKNLSKNSLISLAKKAKNGGVGILTLNSDTSPKIDNEMAIEFIKHITNEIEILPLIASNNANNKICDISILNSLGGVGINLDSIQDANIIDKIAKYAKMLDIPIFVNADDGLGGVINYGKMSVDLGLAARNPLSEIKEVAKILEVAIFYNIKVIFSAISEIRSIELIKESKKNNPNIFAEVSIHHLILNDESCAKYNTAAKLNPPLKDNKTKELLIQALVDDKIDLLTSLQCACYNSKKEQVFDDAAFGIDAIGEYFSLLYTYLVQTKTITLDKLVTICAKNPATILGLNCGEIKVGKIAKLMLVDLDSTYQVQDSFSPYNNETLCAKVREFI